jgi:CheY-like chemotaxis protein
LQWKSAVERRKGERPQRVLLVDDSDDIREMWRLWLTFWGFSVEEARDGQQAVQKALSHTPDLILMDLWMPVAGGLEAITRLKADSRTANVPLLALSAQTSLPDADTVVAAGADALLLKPCDPDVLLDHIRAAMGKLRPC